MSFLLDTDTCSAFMRGKSAVYSRFIQYSGRLHITTITIGELTTWMLRNKLPDRLQAAFADLTREVKILDITREVAEKFGEVRAHQLDRGTRSPQSDLWIASAALTHDLTLVTHNTADYLNVPGLTVVDWLA